MGLSRRRAALAVLVIADLAWLGLPATLVGATRWVPIVVVLTLHGVLVVAERRRPLLGSTDVLLAAGVVALAALVAAPYGSRDLYQYAAYGRLRAHHGINPYLAGPSAAPTDPLVAHVAPAWRDTPTVYGPLFTAVSAVGALGYGTSALLARLWFQGLAALALLGSTVLLHRRGAPPWVLLLVGLSPALLAVVNGGHNDLVAGALGLAGADLVRRARVGRGAVVLAAACLVKLLAAPIVVGLVVWLLAARRWRDAATLVAAVAGLLVVGYAAVGGVVALAPLGSLGASRSRASPWGVVERLVPAASAWPVGLLASGATVGAGALLGRRLLAHRPGSGSGGDTGVELAVALGVMATALAAYVLPWYPAAFLPLAGLVPRSRAAVALHVVAAALLVAYVQPPGRPTSSLAGAGAVATACGVVLALAAVVVLASPTPSPADGRHRWWRGRVRAGIGQGRHRRRGRRRGPRRAAGAGGPASTRLVTPPGDAVAMDLATLAVAFLAALLGAGLVALVVRSAAPPVALPPDSAVGPELLAQHRAEVRHQLDRVADLVLGLSDRQLAQHGELAASLGETLRATAGLADTTAHLREALASPKARGQWGERMADDVLRLAGFVEGVNYRRQVAVAGGTIPDVTFLLPGDLLLHMDVKFPLDNYLRASNAVSPSDRASFEEAFLRDVRQRVRELAGRGYVEAGVTVDHVLLFIPNESVYGFVHQHDPGLADLALRQKVVLCSPFTLFAVLGVIRQSVEAHEVARTSDEVLALLGSFGDQWTRFSDQLDLVARRFDTVHKGIEELTGPRRRQLERQLDRIEDLRTRRGLADDGTDAGRVGPQLAPVDRAG